MDKKYETQKIKLLNDMEQEAQGALGPNTYVIRAMKPIVESNFSLLESNYKVVKSIDNLGKTTEKTEKVMIWITIAATFVGVVQLVVAIIK